MRVVHVASTFPPVLGGMEKVVQILAGLQKANGLSSSVITSNRGVEGHTSEAENYEVTRLKSFSLLSTTIMPALLYRLLREGRKSIVHLHVTQAYAPEIVWLASKIRQFKYIAHIHIDTPPSTQAGILLIPYKKIILKQVLKSARFVIVFTEEQKDIVCKRYGLDPAKVRIVPNGVEETFYAKAPRTMHKKPRLLFVGRLSLQKNIPMLLHALQGVSEYFDTTLVGDGELGGELRRLSKHLKLKNVHFVGRKSGAELRMAYRAADIFVLTSEREGMPLVLLEAMAMAMPIVATNVSGSRDVVSMGKNGYLVELGDAVAFQQALMRVKENAESYRQFSAKSLALSRNYSWKLVSAEIQELYIEALR